MTREDLENIIDFFTEKPAAAALVINCDEKIIKFLEPTEEDIADSKPNYICTLNENYKHWLKHNIKKFEYIQTSSMP